METFLFKQVSIYYSCLGEYYNAPEIFCEQQNFLGWVKNDWIFIFGCNVPLRVGESFNKGTDMKLIYVSIYVKWRLIPEQK